MHRFCGNRLFTEILLPVPAFLLLAIHTCCLAQVIPDNTLSSPSQINTNGSLTTVTGGEVAGQNLFHSFSQFSVPNSSTVHFDNGSNIQRIFSRVTGGSVTRIDGLVRANGLADLFLINPNGLIVGPNAALDIGGSFVGTTASHIRFADHTSYPATPASTAPLLTVSLPIGLQFDGASGAISVQGSGHNIVPPPDRIFPLSPNSTPAFQVSPGRTLALIGGNIGLRGGILLAESGHISLGGIREGIVHLNPNGNGWLFDYSPVLNFGDVALSQQSLVDVSGNQAGYVSIYGNTISLSDNSLVLIQHQGAHPGDSAQFFASEQLSLQGNPQDDIALGSNILVENVGNQNSGEIQLVTQDLLLKDASSIESAAFGSGQSAPISINASKSVVALGSNIQGGIATSTFSAGNAGDIEIFTNSLHLINGGIASSQTNFSRGTSGKVTIQASERINVSGTTRDGLLPSLISTSTVGANNAGTLTLNTADLVIKDGARISSATVSQGSAGDIRIFASNSVDISGTSLLGKSTFPSTISAAAALLTPQQLAAIRRIPGVDIPDIPTGESGSIFIQTPKLSIRDGAQVSVNHLGTAAAGNLIISSGDVFLTNDGQLGAITESGRGGNIHLSAQNLTLNKSAISADSLNSQAGNISLDIQNLLLLRNKSKITTSSNVGLGGNIRIDAKLILAFPSEDSDIFANAQNGPGGRINITTQRIFGLEVREELTNLSDITAISEADPQLNGIVEINTPEVDPSENLSEQPDTVEQPAKIEKGCQAQAAGSSFVNKGRGGLPQNPAAALSGEAVWQDLRARQVQSTEQPVGQAMPQRTSEMSTSGQSKWVEAKGWRRLPDGKVRLVAHAVNYHNLPPTGSC